MAFVPWILSLEERAPRQAFRSGYLIGLIFFGGTIWWIGHVTIPGAVLLPAALALFFAAWGWFANRILKTGRPWTAALLLPASWVALEYLRSHLLTGFGWNLLAHTQWNWLEVIQPAAVTGVWGISFLVLMVNAALCLFLDKKKWLPLLLAVLCLLGAVAYGKAVLRDRRVCKLAGPFIQVALLQGNIPQTEKWDEEFQEAIWKRYEELMAKAVSMKPDLIVWPETSVPGYLEDPAIEERLLGISRSAGAELLVGLPTEDAESGLPYNTALLLDKEGQERARYSKIHLVPFGEFIPIKPIFGWLKKYYPVADFAPGKEWTVFPTKPPVSVLVCFEDLFPELARRFVRGGAGWLLVITNDAWFGRSAASLQHLQASVFRAVENRVWVARSANTGWTGFVDPTGWRQGGEGQISRFKAGVAVSGLSGRLGRTFYTRWGDWLPILCLGLTGLALIIKSHRGNSRSA